MKVERISNYDQFIETKEDWNSVLSKSGQHYPFLTHQWFDAWWQGFGQDGEMEILFFWDDQGSLAGIAPLMIHDNVLQFMANHEVTDYCDFICIDDKRDEFYTHLLDYFEKDPSKYYPIEFINIPESSDSLSRLPGLAAKRNLSHDTQESEVVPVLSLPKSYDEFLRNLGRKNRHELRRKIRKWDSVGDVRIERITDPGKLGSVIKEFVALHKASSLAKKEFWEKQGMSEFFSGLVRKFSKENWVELDAQYVGNRMIAALLSFFDEFSVYFYNIAFDREYSDLSPGFYLFDHAIKQAITEGKLGANFLRGREKYKYFFGAEESKIYNLTLKHTLDRP
jgi:CelD/BcsL family acetyltransferase involved in cellulose biosynthesis